MSNNLPAIAQRLANEHLREADFSLVYEDPKCINLTDNQLREIHNLITHSTAQTPESTKRH